MKRLLKRLRVFTLLLGALFASGLLVFACQSDLPPAYDLTDARVLAIRATPTALVPDGSTTLDALVYVPPGGPAPTYAWSWCVAVDASFTCTTSAATLTTLLDPSGTTGVTIDYDLGSAATATFAYPASADVIRAACNQRGDGGADAGDDDGGDGGDAGDDGGDDAAVDAGDDAGDAGDGGTTGPDGLRCAGGGSSLTIDVLLTVTVGDKIMQAARELTLYTTTPTSLNVSPTVLGIAPFTEGTTLADADLADADLGPDGSIVDGAAGAAASGGTEIVADVPASSSELATNDFGGVGGASDGGTDGGDDDAGDLDAGLDAGDAGVTAQTGGTYEALTLAWYVGSGTLDHASTTLAAARADDTTRDWNGLLSNRWVPAAGASSTPLIMVIRDDRGGVGWLVTTVGAP